MEAKDEFLAWVEAHGGATWNGGMRNLKEQYRIVWNASRASLLASVEWSGEEIVRELGEWSRIYGDGKGNTLPSVVARAAARTVFDAQEKERLRAELASVKKHAEAMAWQIEDEEEKVGDEKWGSRIAYRRDFPKDAP